MACYTLSGYKWIGHNEEVGKNNNEMTENRRILSKVRFQLKIISVRGIGSAYLIGFCLWLEIQPGVPIMYLSGSSV